MNAAQNPAGRPPRCDLDAEAAVISASILDEHARKEARALLKPEHFFSSANRLIWQAILDVDDAKMDVDAVSVATLLRSREQLATIGGAGYLGQVIDATPAVAHVGTHARLVLDLARVRKVVSEAQRIAAEGYGDVGDIGQWLFQSASALTQIATSDMAGRAVRIGELTAEIYNQLEHPEEAGIEALGITTGLVTENIVVEAPGKLIIVAARPGMGKSAYALQKAIDATLMPQPGGVRLASLVHSLEMTKAENAARALANQGGLDGRHVMSRQIHMSDWPRLVGAVSRLHAAPVWVDDTPAITLSQLHGSVVHVSRLAQKEGTRLGYVVVDYLQLMKSDGRKGTSREEDISTNSRGLKAIAKSENVCVVALSQLSRKVEERTPPRPQLSDLRESGAIEADADIVKFLYRPEYYAQKSASAVTDEIRGLAECIVAKNRGGRTGVARLRFYGPSTRFENHHDQGDPDE